jgi:hypothetical protein
MIKHKLPSSPWALFNHNKEFQVHLQPLFEGLQYQDLDGMMKSTIHVDEFASKMGEDSDIVVVSFFVRDRQAAKDLVTWFEKGYDFVLDADQSPGEIKPNRYLVYIEMRRRRAVPGQIQRLLDDLATLTEFKPQDWIMHYEGHSYPWSEDTFSRLVPLSPREYRERKEQDLNEMRIAAGMPTKPTIELDSDLKALQSAAGI